MEQKTEDEKLLATRGTKFEDAYQSDDSHDEKMKAAKKEQKIKDKSKKIKKQDEFAAHAFKIASRGEKAAREINEGGIDITPKLGFNKKKETLIRTQKINNHGVSKFESHKNQQAFKDQPKMKDMLRQKIDKKRKVNMKKINQIKVSSRVEK